jgi:CRISPR-associated endonuclease/helicase Cas3
LRAFGLLGKVLVVDEVHACDAYMNRVLEHLLQLHAAMGGCAVLLSATLSLDTRRRLVDAFAEGAGFAPPTGLPERFPQLLDISTSGVSALDVAAPSWAERELEFRRISDTGLAGEWVTEQAERGACVCWVRNTVGDAITAFERLSEALGTERVTLFHARFALGDRLRVERDVVNRFGKASRSERRTGRVVVATQVVEQSLDLDFDEMLTDLAPIDLLLQRAGRLRRHPREANGDPLTRGDGPDRRGGAMLHVLAPEAVDEPGERWIQSFLPGTAAVYDHHGHLWLTARLVDERPSIRLPRDSRAVIEAVFGADSRDRVPAGLERGVIASEGRRRADASLGEWNTIDGAEGYGGGLGAWTDHEDGRTRLGEPTVTLRLARWDGGGFRPLVDEGPRPWALSEVSVRRALVDRVEPPSDPTAAAAFREVVASFGGGPTWFIPVPLAETNAGFWGCPAYDSDGRSIHILYSTSRGLEVER